MRATGLGSRSNRFLLLCPHSAAVEGTLPSHVAETWRTRSDGVGIYDGAEEVSDDLYRFPENMGEECGLGAGIVYGPGNATNSCGQANIALRAYSLAEQ